MPPFDPTFGQGTPIGISQAGPIVKEEDPLVKAKRECREGGGFWDEKTQTCLSLKPKPTEPTEPKTLPLGIDPRTGAPLTEEQKKPTGPAILSQEEEVSARARGEIVITDAQGNKRIQTPQDIAAFGGIGAAQALQEKEAEQARIQQLISTIGTIGTLTPAQQAAINKSQALVAGTVGQIPSILATAGTFAVGGAIAGGPLGAAIGAAVGIVAGIARGILGNIKEQQRGELQAADIELTNARTNMRQLAMLASQDPQNADVYIQQYNAQLTRIHQARRQTKAEVQGDLNAFMEDGREQLADFDAFLIEGGIADVYGQKLAIALALGAPIDFSGEEFLP